MSGRFYLNLGGSIANLGAIRWGFRAPVKAYDEIADALGVVKVDDANKTGITYGVNQPRPARVRISFSETQVNDPLDATLGSGSSTYTGTAIRFCEPDQLNNVLFGGINDKQVTVRNVKYYIHNVTIK